MADVRTVQIGNREFRLPFIDLIPYDDEQNQSLGRTIREDGRVKESVLCWKDKSNGSYVTVVDGAHRCVWCSMHGLEQPPLRYESFPDEASAIAECRRLNLERRHLTGQQLEHERRKRVEKVAELRAEGRSIRTIAKTVEVSKSQVERDLEKSPTVPGGDTSNTNGETPKKPTGKRQSSASNAKKGRPKKPKPPTLCKRCARISVPSCPKCKEAFAPRPLADAPDREPGVEPDEPEPTPLLDAEGETVPLHAHGAFEVAGKLTLICQTFDTILKAVEEMAKGPGGRLIRFESFKQQVKDAKGNLWANRATHLCPYCKGKTQAKTCECCKGEGWTSKLIWIAAPGNNAK